uniref:USP domain-containing protein n=1 Tax=Leptobrachium leishanense TaxID=445787 RepID=A0A8C5PLT9_9ANUR
MSALPHCTALLNMLALYKYRIIIIFVLVVIFDLTIGNCFVGLMNDDSKWKMYEDGYLNCSQILEVNESDPVICGASSGKQLSYSAGKFKNGVIGLCNVGVRSGLNSLLQTFYMNQNFSEVLCGIEESNDNVPLKRRLPYELLALFEEMQNSKEDAVAPYRILACLRVANQTLLNLYDVGELFFKIWNLLLQQMSHPYLEDKLRTLYMINWEETFTCQKCSHQRTSVQNVLTISLNVCHSKHHRNLTLQNCLRRFFKPKEVFAESNGACPKCGENSTSVKGIRLVSLPHTLNIHLKRLSPKKSTLKTNRILSFPDILDLSEVLDPEYLPSEGQDQFQWFGRGVHSRWVVFRLLELVEVMQEVWSRWRWRFQEVRAHLVWRQILQEWCGLLETR